MWRDSLKTDSLPLPPPLLTVNVPIIEMILHFSQGNHYAAQHIRTVASRLDRTWKEFAAGLDERTAVLGNYNQQLHSTHCLRIHGFVRFRSKRFVPSQGGTIL